MPETVTNEMILELLTDIRANIDGIHEDAVSILMRWHSVTAKFDSINKIYYVESSDIPGLHLETATLDEFKELVANVAPDLLPGPHGIRVTIHTDVYVPETGKNSA